MRATCELAKTIRYFASDFLNEFQILETSIHILPIDHNELLKKHIYSPPGVHELFIAEYVNMPLSTICYLRDIYDLHELPDRPPTTIPQLDIDPQESENDS